MGTARGESVSQARNLVPYWIGIGFVLGLVVGGVLVK